MLFAVTVCVKVSVLRQRVLLCPEPLCHCKSHGPVPSPLFPPHSRAQLRHVPIQCCHLSALPSALTPPFLVITVYLLLNVHNVMFCKLLIYISNIACQWWCYICVEKLCLRVATLLVRFCIVYYITHSSPRQTDRRPAGQ